MVYTFQIVWLNVILDELEVSSLDEPVAYEKFLDESNSWLE